MRPTGRRFQITDATGGAAFGVRVVTRARQTEVAGIQEDGFLRVRLMAREAHDPAANAELIQLLAGLLGVGPEQIEIVAGENASDKIISIDGVRPAEIEARLGIG